MDNKLLIKEFYEEVVSKNLIDKIENYVDINCTHGQEKIQYLSDWTE